MSCFAENSSLLMFLERLFPGVERLENLDIRPPLVNRNDGAIDFLPLCKGEIL